MGMIIEGSFLHLGALLDTTVTATWTSFLHQLSARHPLSSEISFQLHSSVLPMRHWRNQAALKEKEGLWALDRPMPGGREDSIWAGLSIQGCAKLPLNRSTDPLQGWGGNKIRPAVSTAMPTIRENVVLQPWSFQLSTVTPM